MLATLAQSGSCNAATVGFGANVLATGVSAWGSSPRGVRAYPGALPTTYVYSETQFTSATLSVAELTALDNKCSAKSGDLGLCSVCKAGLQ